MTMARLIFPTILSCIIAYLLCGIPFGLLVARAHGVDVRKVGSGNIGTTNVARAAGVGASGLTLLLDAGKGFVSMMIARLIIPAMGQVEVKAIAPDQPSGIVIAIVKFNQAHFFYGIGHPIQFLENNQQIIRNGSRANHFADYRVAVRVAMQDL